MGSTQLLPIPWRFTLIGVAAVLTFLSTPRWPAPLASPAQGAVAGATR